MNNIKELAEKARELKAKGFSTGEISDELNISKETALWLLTHDVKEAEKKPQEIGIRDVYVNWQSAGKSATRLYFLSIALLDLIIDYFEENSMDENIDVVVGIANSGIPIASYIALELESELALVVPKKRIWEPEKEKMQSGYILSNFASVKNKNAIIVDDIVTTGSTIKEVAQLIKANKGRALIAGVLLDKTGKEKIGNIPLISLFKVSVI